MPADIGIYMASILGAKAGRDPVVDGIATFLNPHSYLLLRNSAALLSRFDRIYYDGILMSLLARMIGAHEPRRSFDMTGLAPAVFQAAARNRQTVALVASEPGAAERVARKVAAAYPGLNIGTVSSGYFVDEHSREDLLERLSLESPDYVIVGMGAPLQESFLVDLRSRGWHGCGYTCGGFVHQSDNGSSGLGYYPPWINNFQLRWAYRMLREPQLRSRYLLEYPRAILTIMADFVRFRRHVGKSGG